MRPTNRPLTPFFSAPASSSFPPCTATRSLHSSTPYWNENQDQLPEPWSQLLTGGLVNEDAMVGMGQRLQSKKLVNWGDGNMVNMNWEKSGDSSYCNRVYQNQEVQAGAKRSWSQTVSSSVSSANSSFNCSTAAGGAGKKPRVQLQATSEFETSQTTTSKVRLQVRKEKLGDRITALHQLVSPFGKTDTASVLLEAIGYIRFLESQIEVMFLNFSFLHSLVGGPARMRQQQYSGCEEEPKKDLRSRGLYLVPISYTHEMDHVGGDNGADCSTYNIMIHEQSMYQNPRLIAHDAIK